MSALDDIVERADTIRLALDGIPRWLDLVAASDNPQFIARTVDGIRELIATNQRLVDNHRRLCAEDLDYGVANALIVQRFGDIMGNAGKALDLLAAQLAHGEAIAAKHLAEPVES
jgi:hypothetical protein